ncbi:MAG: hypothetical protein A2081_00960 [Elusimicrobia bacterium GWC2_61_19]|nr:MAG: hypothetical protein A2081_00960 [Elusimicrobia bacterium GWC2_61_19]HBB67824.1 nitrous oxide-stimulated promoter family protein [Elusimicrobiota bacterium]
MQKNIALEIESLEKMLVIYCGGVHANHDLCPACHELLVYAAGRLAKCPHHPKPACKKCPTHCFPPERREQLRAVMRHAAPKMLFYHPLLTLRHYL